MLDHKFYYGSIRKIIIAFGALFNDIQFDREDESGVFKTIDVPLIYSPKEKFVRRIHDASQPNTDEVWVKETLPRMGFEMTAMSYAPERKTNTMDRIVNNGDPVNQYMYNRVPYNFNFSLYLGTRKFDDSLRIVEQILPYFTPEFTVKIIDKEDFGIDTNIPFVLDDTAFEIDEESSMEDSRRTILWTMQFTAKGYLYPATSSQTIIKKSVIDIRALDTSAFIEEYMAYVDPLDANIDDPHTIVELVNDTQQGDELGEAHTGSLVEIATLD